MLRSRALIITVLGAALSVFPVLAQEAGRSEASVQAFGSFVKSTTDNGVRQGATNSGGVLGSYRFFFNNNHGVEVNYGYSRNSQTFGLPAGDVGIQANQHEISAAYVYRRPLKSFTPFALAGVGGLVFDPRDFAAGSSQTRAA